MKKILLIYIPVFHQGYVKLFRKSVFDEICLIGDLEFIIKNDLENRAYLNRSFLHAVDSLLIKESVKFILKSNQKITIWSGRESLQKNIHFLLPDDDISSYLIEDYLQPHCLSYEVINGPFLRWSKGIPKQESQPENVPIAFEGGQFIRKIVKLGYEEAGHSSDWWRQVGAVLFNEETEKVLFSGYNKHLPGGIHQSSFGDARSSFNPGERSDLCCAIHAEKNVFAKALRAGISTEGLSMYTTTYPCSMCADFISETGIKKVYYTEGYSVMEQAGSAMRAKGIEIIHVPKEVLE